MENYEQLLKEISLINKKYDQLHRQTGRQFNIFQIIGVAEDERKICRIIAELLNPKGCHYQGAAYLKLFVENVLIGEKRFNADYFNNFNYDNAVVITEHAINGKQDNGNYGYIDIVIKDSTRFIPIEVKIFATDQEQQCFRYHTEALAYDKDSKVCYLTLDSHVPTENSLCDKNKNKLNVNQYFCISFKEDIIRWLNECIKQNSTIRLAPIREILLQLISSFEYVLGVNEEDVSMELKSIIGSSSSNMKSAIDIANCIKDVKVDMLDKLLVALEAEVDPLAVDRGFVKDSDYGYYKKEYEQLNRFYDADKNSCSGFSYKIDSINQDFELWFRIDIDKDLAAGFCTFNVKENKLLLSDANTKLEILSKFPKIPSGLNRDDNWIYFELLPENDDSRALNFKRYNDLYYSLYDDEKFKEFIINCQASIIKVMDICK